ncbi:UNVERIFIED_CONTAM: DEAD-box ATP-dependent RNA helicase 5 [Sesamum calycinum]|uniref:DEAD-box ATP-dependent RNA helicase 5 n=1 Tax=Sesamum calycinum TaxID=2727403 RepID=A0AAW2IUZ7_9LAMI
MLLRLITIRLDILIEIHQWLAIFISDIVIRAPGRLKDLIGMEVCSLKEVLDEVDRMLDLGFESEVRSILSQASSVRQMVVFSTTWPPAVHQLGQEFMDPHPVKVLDDRACDERLQTLLEKYHKSRKKGIHGYAIAQYATCCMSSSLWSQLQVACSPI